MQFQAQALHLSVWIDFAYLSDFVRGQHFVVPFDVWAYTRSFL